MKQVFDDKVVNILGLKDTKGDVGIEIEMELKKPIRDIGPLTEVWRVEGDGSLKVNGVEFVLRNPVNFNEVPKLIYTLRKGMKKKDNVINESYRAGIHVHLNMQQSTVNQVFKLLCCYYPMEAALTRYCGNGREGNLFCLRARDALGVISTLEKTVETGNLAHLNTDKLRYAAMNVRSLFNYGTVEFRALATTPDLGLINDWVRMIACLKNYSESIESCWDPMYSISGDGPRQWMTKVFGPELFSKLDYKGLEDDVLKDSRNIQYLISLLEG